MNEIAHASLPNLDLDIDPKLSWALRTREQFPVDVNRAPKEMLLRVPGFGMRTVERILLARRLHPVSLTDLARLRVREHVSRLGLVVERQGDDCREDESALTHSTAASRPLPWEWFCRSHRAPSIWVVMQERSGIHDSATPKRGGA